MPSYKIEAAKSGRSSCKKCKEKIGKGEIRIGTVSMKDDIEMVGWRHVKCFALPRNCVKEGVTVEDFVDDQLEDEGGVLAESRDQVIADILHKEDKKAAAAKKKATAEGGDGGSKIEILKRAYEQSKANDDESDEKQPKKKKKKTDALKQQVDIYARYAKTPVDGLKDVLRWNKQFLTGKRNDILARIIDGEVNGRLGACPLCVQGRLKYGQEQEEHVTCNGYFDEDNQIKISCSYKEKIENAPRLYPWYSDEPTEEQKEALEKQLEEARGQGDVTKGNPEATEAMAKQVKQMDWKTDSSAEIKETTAALVKIVKDHLDLPENKKQAIGRLILQHKSEKSKEEILMAVIEEYGFASVKKERAKKQEDALTASCVVKENAGLVAAFAELKDLYFKAGNRNAGMSYQRVTSVLKELDFAVTEKNAKGLGKGKTKIDGVGKTSAERMYEFVTTGTMAKLEEKRAEMA